MRILKTYARLWTEDLDTALPLLTELTGRRPDLRLAFEGVELAALGDFLVIAGPAAERARYTHASATAVVDDLDAVATALAAAGATVTTPLTGGPTGRFLYARHADGAEIEYVEWTPEIRTRILGS
ncbi:VOC family protein [Streptomyces physcomitrii]|uniref:VOC family protein n=1 Tax=Streptomyces physcomitrii TaxID=2724184 RepID=A0ABX1H0Z6_9ACTN|nr:VOC family protein [Streptomyces physcomitrii]NKI40979.1 VOC family protein [Streptomyces physcomitrii]